MDKINGISVEQIIEKQGITIYIVTPPPKEAECTLDEYIEMALESFSDASEITISFPVYYPRKPDSWSEARAFHEREFAKRVDDFSEAVEDFVNVMDDLEEEE